MCELTKVAKEYIAEKDLYLILSDFQQINSFFIFFFKQIIMTANQK